MIDSAATAVNSCLPSLNKRGTLGPHDGGYEGHARRDFPDAGLTALFADSQAVGDHCHMVTLCSTDRVSFSRTSDRRHTAIPLADVPPLVFTEAMRDVDLFVSVTSIALHPNWADRGDDDPYLGYWNRYSFSEFSQTAVIRRDALGRILPKLKIAPRVQFTERHLHVQGNLNSHKIHIGSGNILIEPDDRYLCIFPDNRASKVMLPFDGDHVLSIILSKALLLAADDKITDPTIVGQLKRR
jgi:hypothetical protein